MQPETATSHNGTNMIGYLILALFIWIGSCFCASSCSIGKTSMTAHACSNQFEIREKIAFMKRYVTTPSEIIDAEFCIDYFDNSKGLVAGPSDWKISVIVKVQRNEVQKWTEGFSEEERRKSI